jgi:hypothetical protein
MKKPMMNKSLARLGASVFLSGLFLLHAGTAKAQVAATHASPDSVMVTFIGSQEGSYIFDVQFDNNAGETYIVAIVDDAGNTLFKSFYSDKKFDKKFKLPPETDVNSVSFVIRNLHSNASVTYAVNTTERSVQDVSVKRTH